MPASPIGPTVALTGTPGTGKTSVAAWLSERGYGVLGLSRFVGDPRFDLGADDEREGTRFLDEEALGEYLRENLLHELGPRTQQGPVFIESHFAHDFAFVDRIIVLRCRPSVLKKRLQQRGYGPEKIRENLEVEGMDLVLQEAVQTRDEQAVQGHRVAVAQVDASTRSVEETAAEVLELASAPSENLEIARVDWSDEVLGWY